MLGGGEGSPAQGTAEVPAVEPAVETALVEHVAAGEPPHVVPVLEVAEADDAAVLLIRGRPGGETAGKGAVEVELVGKRDEAGEAGVEGCENRVIVVVVKVKGFGRRGEAERVEDGGEGVAEIAEAGSEQGEEQERDGVR